MAGIFKLEKDYKRCISIRLENTLINRIDKIAFKTQMSRNQIIQKCIIYALDNLKIGESTIEL